MLRIELADHNINIPTYIAFKIHEKLNLKKTRKRPIESFFFNHDK